MGLHKKTLRKIEEALVVLEENHPMTLRQVFYQLVSRQALKNTKSQYDSLGRALVRARQEGLIPWEWMEDRIRQPRHVSMWDGLADFKEMAKRVYRRNVWLAQPGYIECWVEKDALSGIFLDELLPYGVTLNVGRGYDGWDSIHNAAQRWGDGQGITVLYFGDFDPSGEDIPRSLVERLAFFNCYPDVVVCALTLDDVRRYNLPPDFTKATDTRRDAFVEKYGDIAVELDALSVDVLRARIRSEIEARMDLDALNGVRQVEAQEKVQLMELLS